MIKKKLSSKRLKRVWNFAVKSKLFKRALVSRIIPIIVAQYVGVHYIMYQSKKQWKKAAIAKEYEFVTTVITFLITMIFNTGSEKPVEKRS